MLLSHEVTPNTDKIEVPKTRKNLLNDKFPTAIHGPDHSISVFPSPRQSVVFARSIF